MELANKFPLHIYNSLGKKKEKFVPVNEGKVGLYVCGPTVYNFVHLGNVRTFLTFDVVYRYLRYLGYRVRYVRNITDVGHLVDDLDEGEDKIAKKAKLENLEPMEVVQRYTNDFHEVLRLFNFEQPSIEPTATGHIIEQIGMIEQILANGFAYEVNGSVYFDVPKFQEQKGIYGDLSGRVLEDLMVNTRDLDGQEEKRNAQDFALWKRADVRHIMRWPSPWGEGFPGWHLECSAMSTKYLGQEFDIHGGGMDLKFPHHECEIAQNVACHGHLNPVKYWMHSNMLTVNGKKMSKSLGNSFTPRELLSGDHPLLERAYSAMTVRFFMLQSHYSSTLDFTNEALQAAEKGYKRLMNAMGLLHKLEAVGNSDLELEKQVETWLNECFVNLSDDFNTAKCIAVLFELTTLINDAYHGGNGKIKISVDLLNRIKNDMDVLVTQVLGLKDELSADSGSTIDGLMTLLIDIRHQARAKKDFATSDQIRNQLSNLGIKLKDGNGTTEWQLD